jgi:putative membrane protein
MMTARIGIAAMETARPLPFSALRRPGMGDFLSALTKFASARASGKSAAAD